MGKLSQAQNRIEYEIILCVCESDRTSRAKGWSFLTKGLNLPYTLNPEPYIAPDSNPIRYDGGFSESVWPLAKSEPLWNRVLARRKPIAATL